MLLIHSYTLHMNEFKENEYKELRKMNLRDPNMVDSHGWSLQAWSWKCLCMHIHGYMLHIQTPQWITGKHFSKGYLFKNLFLKILFITTI